MFVLRAALIALAATAMSSGVLAQGKPVQTRPSPAKKPPAQAVTRQQDQSYLFLPPSSGNSSYPNYMVTGTRHSDQPYFGTHVDRFGMRQIEH